MNNRTFVQLNDDVRSYDKLFCHSLFVILLFYGSIISPSLAEQTDIDSLTSRLQENLHDTDRVKTLNKLAWKMIYTNPDTPLSSYLQKPYQLQKHTSGN